MLLESQRSSKKTLQNSRNFLALDFIFHFARSLLARMPSTSRSMCTCAHKYMSWVGKYGGKGGGGETRH